METISQRMPEVQVISLNGTSNLHPYLIHLISRNNFMNHFLYAYRVIPPPENLTGFIYIHICK